MLVITVELPVNISIGLALMLEGDYKEADTFLQLSARWSESQIDQCKSLSNLGALQFIQCSDAKYNYAQTLQLEFVDSWNFKLQPSEFESSASEYFEDAIKLSTDPLNSNVGTYILRILVNRVTVVFCSISRTVHFSNSLGATFAEQPRQNQMSWDLTIRLHTHLFRVPGQKYHP